MSSSAIHGLQGQIYVSSTQLAELVDVTLTITSSPVNVTNHTTSVSGGVVWAESIPGVNQWSATATVNYVQSETTMTTLEDAIINQTALAFEFRDKTGTGRKKWTGTGYITSFRLNMPQGDRQTAAIDVSAASALTRGTQA